MLLTNGAVVGTLAAFIGTIAGLALWVVFAPTLESAVDHRIDRLSLPWTLIAMAVVLAVVGATAAAWWPGRTVARLPVVLALSGRPPKPRPARHSAIAAAALIAVGVGCLALSDRDSPLLIIAGLVATILGTLLLGPWRSAFCRAAGHAPIAARLALRDLARYQARSGAALAAITLALGIAAAVVITAAAAEKQEDERAAAGLPTCPTARSACTRGQHNARISSRSRSKHPRSSHGVPRTSANSPQASPGNRDPASKALQPGEPPIVEGGNRALVTVGLARQVDPKRWTRGIGTLRRHACPARAPRNRPRDDRSERGLPGRPTVPTDELVILDFRARKQLAVTNVQRIDSQEVLGSGGDTGAHRPRSSPSTVFAAAAGRRSRPAGSSSRAGPSRASRSPPPASSPPRPASRSRRSERAPPSPRPSPSRPPRARFWRWPSSR